MTTVKSATAAATKTAKTAQAAFEQVTGASSQAMREHYDRSLAAMSEMSSFGKQNVEAMIASASAAQRGFETLSQRAAAFTKLAVENHMAAAKSLMTSKSVQEFVEKQTEYARSSFDAYVAELNSLSDVVADVAKEAMQPLNERMSAVSHLMQNPPVR